MQTLTTTWELTTGTTVSMRKTFNKRGLVSQNARQVKFKCRHHQSKELSLEYYTQGKRGIYWNGWTSPGPFILLGIYSFDSPRAGGRGGRHRQPQTFNLQQQQIVSRHDGHVLVLFGLTPSVFLWAARKFYTINWFFTPWWKMPTTVFFKEVIKHLRPKKRWNSGGITLESTTAAGN